MNKHKDKKPEANEEDEVVCLTTIRLDIYDLICKAEVFYNQTKRVYIVKSNLKCFEHDAEIVGQPWCDFAFSKLQAEGLDLCSFISDWIRNYYRDKYTYCDTCRYFIKCMERDD